MTLTDDSAALAPIELAPPSRRGRGRTLLVVTVLAAAVIGLASQGLLHNLNYFDTVRQALAQRHTLGTAEFRLEGVVTDGSIQRTSTGASFYLNGSRPHQIFVVAYGQPPQLFQGNIPVVVDGHFTSVSSMTFVATQIIVKHSSTYVARHPHRVQAPNGSVR